MSDPRTHSFVKARTDHALETAADYVELIQDLVEETGEARAADIAIRMGVSHVTVSKTLQRLSKEGFVTYRPYRSIFLTQEGRKLAASAKERHQLVLELLNRLGVPPAIAEQDAEGMEHHASETTLDAIRTFIGASAKQPAK